MEISFLLLHQGIWLCVIDASQFQIQIQFQFQFGWQNVPAHQQTS